MALQGTLETFALADVLRLLASTKKSGILRIDGDRGYGEMAVIDGELVGAQATGAPRAERPAEVLFELLRYQNGSFVFDGEGDVRQGDHRASVDEALADAEEQLREWREIEAVVPSPTRLITLVPERDKDITLNARQWSAIVALGTGATPLELGDRLGVSELPATRMVRDLVELGAVEVGEEVEAGFSASTAPTEDDPEPVPEIDETPLETDLSPLDLGGDEIVDAADEFADDGASEVLTDTSETLDDSSESLDDILAGATTPPPPPVAEAETSPEPTIDLQSDPPFEPLPPAGFQPSIVPDPPAAPSNPVGDGPLSFADSPSLIAEPAPPAAPAAPAPGAGGSPLFAPAEPPSSAFAPADAAFAPAPPPAFAAPPPPPPPPAPSATPDAFAPASDSLGGWNDDDDDDGLSSFHSDDDSVPLFGASADAPGPDDPFGPDPFTIPSFTQSPTDAKEAEEAAELARQLANLSPRAQQAVAAAAAAGTDEERNQAIARAEQASDEPINRNLLLKYLSSVDE